MSDENSSEQSETGTYESGEGVISRRDLLQALGAGSLLATVVEGSGSAHRVSDSGIDIRTESGSTINATTTQTQSLREYTLTVTDSTGDFEQSVSIEDETDLSKYGEHIGFRTIGDTRDDNDSGIIDEVRLGTGETVEDWEDEGDSGGWMENYHRTNSGGGEFQVAGSPTTGGEYALQLYSGCCGDTITSDEAVLPVDPGITVSADIRHQTDNSDTYAHTTQLKLGTDIDGNGGIDFRLINPGSERTAGARLRTPNAEGRIEFDPKLNEFYKFSITISQIDTTATVEGTVRDEETVEGLPEVTVTFTRERDGNEFTTETFVDEPGRPGDVGGYTIQLPVDGGTETTYEIVVDTDGYQEFTDEITLSPDETQSKDISLLPVDATVEGTVRDEQTLEGLPEVTVTFTRDEEEFTTETFVDEPGREGGPGDYIIQLPVDEGTEATYEIVVDTDGYQEFTDTITLSPDDNTTKEIKLTPNPARFSIEDVRPVQTVFNTGLTENMDLVDGKDTAFLIYPSIENFEGMSDDAEITIKIRSSGEILTGGSGTLFGQVTLIKGELEVFDTKIVGESPQVDVTEFLGRKDVIPKLPMTNTVGIPSSFNEPIRSGEFQIFAETDSDSVQIESGSVGTPVSKEVTVHKTAEITLYAVPSTEARKQKNRVTNTYIPRMEDYLEGVLPLDEDGLEIIYDESIVPAPSNGEDTSDYQSGTLPDTGPKDFLTLDMDEAVWNEYGSPPQETNKSGVAYGVIIVTETEADNLGMEAGYTVVDGGPRFEATNIILVRLGNWTAAAHELGHQFGLHNGKEEYKIEKKDTVRGYWVNQPNWVANLKFENGAQVDGVDSLNYSGTIQNSRYKSYMGSAVFPPGLTDVGLAWPSNTKDYDSMIKPGAFRPGDYRDYDQSLSYLKRAHSETSVSTIGTQTESRHLTLSTQRGDSTDSFDERVLYFAAAFLPSDEVQLETVHYYEDSPTAVTGGNYAFVGLNQDSNTTIEKRIEPWRNVCTYSDGGIETHQAAKAGFAMPYPPDTETVEIRRVSEDRVVSMNNDGPEVISEFDPRVEVLRGELDSVPRDGFKTDDPEAVQETRNDLHAIIDDIEARYESNDDEAAVELIQTEFQSALGDALKDDYEASGPIKRSRDDIQAAIDDTVDRSVNDSPDDESGSDNNSNDSSDDESGSDNTSNDSSDDGSGGDGFGPGFGIGGALTSIGGAAYLLKRRLGDDDSEE